MNKRLYLLSLISFYTHAGLTDVPAEVLFAWKDRVVKNKNDDEFTWTAKEVQSDWRALPAELKFAVARRMVLADCEKLPTWVKLGVLQPWDSLRDLIGISHGRFAMFDGITFQKILILWGDVLDIIPERVIHLGEGGVSGGQALSRDGNQFAFMDMGDSTVSIVPLAQGATRTFPLPGGADLSGAIVWTSANILAFGFSDGRVGTLNTENGAILSRRGQGDGQSMWGPLAWNERDNVLAYGRQPRGPYTSLPVIIYDLCAEGQERVVEFPLQEQAHFIGFDEETNELDVSLSWGQKIMGLDLKTGEMREKFKPPVEGYLKTARGDDGRVALQISDDQSFRTEVWAYYGEILRKYFARDMEKLIGENKLSARKAYAQMVMTALFFDLKQKGKALKIPQVVAEINKRAKQDITSAEDLAQIRDTFPIRERIALQKVFNISRK